MALTVKSTVDWVLTDLVHENYKQVNSEEIKENWAKFHFCALNECYEAAEVVYLVVSIFVNEPTVEENSINNQIYSIYKRDIFIARKTS